MRKKTEELCKKWVVYWICPREDREKLAVELSRLMQQPMDGNQAAAQMASFNESIEMRAEEAGRKSYGLEISFDDLCQLLHEHNMEFNFKNIRDIVTSFAIRCELVK